MKHTHSALLLVCLAVFLLTGCGSGKAGSSENPYVCTKQTASAGNWRSARLGSGYGDPSVLLCALYSSRRTHSGSDAFAEKLMRRLFRRFRAGFACGLIGTMGLLGLIGRKRK